MAKDTVIVASNHVKTLVFRLPGGRRVSIAGNTAGLVGLPKGQVPAGAYGFTEVAKADWDYIKAGWADFEPIKNGLLFAASDRGRAEDEAKEKAALRNGHEPVEPASAKTEAAKAA